MGGKPVVYIVGSLRNPEIPRISNLVRDAGYEPFSDWYGGGPTADDTWKSNELAQGRTYVQALRGYLAQNTFALDKRHLDRCNAAVMVMPAGRSAHLEFGYITGQGKPGIILYPGEPAADERWDVMSAFAYVHGGGVCFDEDQMLAQLECVFQPAPVPTQNPNCRHVGGPSQPGDCSTWSYPGVTCGPYWGTEACHSCADFYHLHSEDDS